MQHGGGYRVSVRPRQADAGVSRLDAARRQQRRQPVRLPHHVQRRPKVYDAADTGLFGDMRLIGEEGIDLALLPIGDNYTMGPDDALRAVKLLQAAQGDADPLQHLRVIRQDAAAWAERVRRETEAEPVLHPPGTWFEVNVDNLMLDVVSIRRQFPSLNRSRNGRLLSSSTDLAVRKCRRA